MSKSSKHLLSCRCSRARINSRFCSYTTSSPGTTVIGRGPAQLSPIPSWPRVAQREKSTSGIRLSRSLKSRATLPVVHPQRLVPVGLDTAPGSLLRLCKASRSPTAQPKAVTHRTPRRRGTATRRGTVARRGTVTR
jgi:hypothetical protein